MDKVAAVVGERSTTQSNASRFHVYSRAAVADSVGGWGLDMAVNVVGERSTTPSNASRFHAYSSAAEAAS